MEATSSRPPISLVTVIQGLEQMRLELPLSLVELIPQLDAKKHGIMECMAAHNTDGEILVKMQKSSTQLIIDLHSNAPGQSLMADMGSGWQCVINKVKGDIFHYLFDANEDADLNEEIQEPVLEDSTLEGHTLHLEEEQEEQVELLGEVNEQPEVNTDCLVVMPLQMLPESAEIVAEETVSHISPNEVIVEAAATATDTDALYPEHNIEYISVGEDVTGVTVPSAVEQGGDTVHWALNVEEEVSEHIEENMDGIDVLDDDAESGDFPQRLPRIMQDIVVYKCNVCANNFPKVESLAAHLKRRHGQDELNPLEVETVVMKDAHICFLCQAVSPNYESIRKHLQRVHNTGDRLRTNRKAGLPGMQGLECSICHKLYVSLQCLGMHVRNYHKNHPDIKIALREVQNLRDEQSKHQGKVVIQCLICQEQCRGRRIFRHMKQEHPDVDNIEDVLKQTRKKFQEQAKKVWNYNTDHQLENIECPQCNTKMQRKSLRRHFRYCSGKPKADCDQPKVQCPDCGKEIVEYYLQRHRKDRCIVKTKQPWDCKECDETFPNRYALNKHVRCVHSDEPPRSTSPVFGVKRTGKGGPRFCEICQTEMTLTWADMRTHRRVMHGLVYDDNIEEAVMECSVCQENIPGGPMKLQLHKKKIHSKCVIFCDICNAEMFSGGPNSLKAHLMSVHSLDVQMTTFQCDHCARLFPRKSALVWHLSGVHGERNQNCPQCTKVFKSRSALKMHFKLVHLKIYSHTCSKCGKGFHKKTHLTSHIDKCTGGAATDEQIASGSDRTLEQTELSLLVGPEDDGSSSKEMLDDILQSAASATWSEIDEEPAVCVWENSSGVLVLKKSKDHDEDASSAVLGDGEPGDNGESQNRPTLKVEDADGSAVDLHNACLQKLKLGPHSPFTSSASTAEVGDGQKVLPTRELTLNNGANQNVDQLIPGMPESPLRCSSRRKTLTKRATESQEQSRSGSKKQRTVIVERSADGASQSASESKSWL